MNFKRIMIYCVMLLMLIVGVASASGGGRFDGDPNFTKVYPTRKGIVTFNHQAHAVMTQSCLVCHRSVLSLGDGHVTKTVGHKLCKICHRDSENKSAPITCTGCHKK